MNIYKDINTTKVWFRVKITFLAAILLLLAYFVHSCVLWEKETEIKREAATYHKGDYVTITELNLRCIVRDIADYDQFRFTLRCDGFSDYNFERSEDEITEGWTRSE